MSIARVEVCVRSINMHSFRGGGFSIMCGLLIFRANIDKPVLAFIQICISIYTNDSEAFEGSSLRGSIMEIRC